MSNLRYAFMKYHFAFRSFFAGLLIPCGFAPFHMPGLAILGMALLFLQLNQTSLKQSLKQSFLSGFVFGLGLFSLGVSWVYVSIHDYGHLPSPLAGLITLVFIAYLALYPACVAMLYQHLATQRALLLNCFSFSALWSLSEYLRATVFSGFPWLLLGTSQMDTPLQYLLPVFGVFGVGFLACFAAASLAVGIQSTRTKRNHWIIAGILILLAPSAFKNHTWTTTETTPVSVGIIQANLSMRDKWDEALFWQLLQRYEDYIGQLIGKKQLIVMPESAIPVPSNYVSDFLSLLDQQASTAGSAVILGIPEPTTTENTAYYNTLTTLGDAQGSYVKQHLVPFGEFIPEPLQALNHWLALPSANMTPGKDAQPLVRVHNHPIASLICYEVAYPQLLRKQLPEAEWIVSISDDGWFGHSLAAYQHVQMSQVLSLQTGRFQIVANNDGLSSIINTKGHIEASLPAFQSGVLNATIHPSHGATPWVSFGDVPVFIMSFIILLMAYLRRAQIQLRNRNLSVANELSTDPSIISAIMKQKKRGKPLCHDI